MGDYYAKSPTKNKKRQLNTYGGKTIQNYHKFLFEESIKHLNKNIELSIADIGSGEGVPLKYFLDSLKDNKFKVKSVYAFDIKKNNNLNDKKEIIKWHVVDVNTDKIPLPDNCVDVVIATELIEHLLVPENLLSEANRILRKGGLFLLSAPNIRWWINILYLIMGYSPITIDVGYYENYGQLLKYPPAGHIRAYTPKNLKNMLEIFGFKIIKMSTISHPNSKIKLVEKFFSLLSFGYWIVIISKKEF